MERTDSVVISKFESAKVALNKLGFDIVNNGESFWVRCRLYDEYQRPLWSESFKTVEELEALALGMLMDHAYRTQETKP